MLDKLYEVEKNIVEILRKELDSDVTKSALLNSMRIDYHDPIVNRVWFQYDEKHRVYLHKIYPTKSSNAALFHPHPWKSAIRIISGSYEMGIGHSRTNELPKSIDCKIILQPYSAYEMIEEHGWHYVNPIKKPSYSLMVTGELNKRKMPIEPNKKFRKLTLTEIRNILYEVYAVYNVHFGWKKQF